MNNKLDQKVIALSISFFFFLASIIVLIFFGIKIFLGPGLSQLVDYALLLLTILIFIVSLILIVKNRKYFWQPNSKKFNRITGLFIIIFGIIELISSNTKTLILPIIFILLGILTLRQSKKEWKPKSAETIKSRSKYPTIIGALLILLAILFWNSASPISTYKLVFLSGGIGALLGGLAAPYIHKKQTEVKK